jgi:hypothetical protein
MNRHSICLAAFALCLSAQAHAQDCSGPVTRVTGDKGYTKFNAFPSNTVVDATGAIWRLSQYPKGRNLWPISISGRTNACLRGGAVIGDTPLDVPTNVRKSKGSAASILVGAHNGPITTGTVVEGTYLYNSGDGIRQADKARNTTFRGNWISTNYEDCIENDALNAMVAEDNFLDGCWTAFSTRCYGCRIDPAATYVIRNNLVRMGPVPGWPSKKLSLSPAYNGVFKSQNKSIKFRIINNVFHISQPSYSDVGGPRDPFTLENWNTNVIESKGNVIVWTGPGAYPYKAPPGFTVTTDVRVWSNAKKAWMRRHPGHAGTV